MPYLKTCLFFKKILIYINDEKLNSTGLSNAEESEYNAYSNQYTLKKYFYSAAEKEYENLNDTKEVLNNHFQDLVKNKQDIQILLNDRYYILESLNKMISNQTNSIRNKEIVIPLEQLKGNLYTIDNLSTLLRKEKDFYNEQSHNMKIFYFYFFNNLTEGQIKLDTKLSIEYIKFKDYVDALQRYSVNSLEVFLKDPLTKELEAKIDIHIKEIRSRLTETIEKPFFLMDLLKNYRLLNDQKGRLYIAWAKSKGHQEIINQWKQENKPIKEAPLYIINMLKNTVKNDLDAAKKQLYLYGNPKNDLLAKNYVEKISALDKKITQASDLQTLIPYIQPAQLCMEAIKIFELSRSDHNQ